MLFQEYLYIAPLHVQLEATKTFSSIIQNGTIPAYMFASSFLPIILHNIDNRDTGKSTPHPSLFLCLNDNDDDDDDEDEDDDDDDDDDDSFN